MFEPSHVETIRRANLATFVSSIFGSQEIGFAELDDRFLDIFVPENGRLLKAQGSLYLDLKTQAFISGLKSGEGSRTEMLYTLFPDDMGAKITARRPGTRNLAPSEQDFVKRAFSRREILLADVNDASALEVLPKRYQWDDFLRDVSSYILKNFDSLNPQAVSIAAFFGTGIQVDLMTEAKICSDYESSKRCIQRTRSKTAPEQFSSKAGASIGSWRSIAKTRRLCGKGCSRGTDCFAEPQYQHPRTRTSSDSNPSGSQAFFRARDTAAHQFSAICTTCYVLSGKPTR